MRRAWVVDHYLPVIVCSMFFSIIRSSSTLVFTQGKSRNIICPIQSMYQFGDSISDTGNLIRIVPNGSALSVTHLPYGSTFPGTPTGRWSDGRLIIDYMAEALGLPLLNPWLDKNASFDNGVNFAVAGSTTLGFLFYLKRGITTSPFPSLRAQLQWFKTHLDSLCNTSKECSSKLSRALFLVGEIGYNDFQDPYRQGRPFEEIKSYLSDVVQTVISVTRELITYGASQVVVPGNFPLGCFPCVLSLSRTSDYDELGCLKSVNKLMMYQNNYLQMSLSSLRDEFPNVVIVYADIYDAFLSMLQNAPNLGFDKTTLFKACCGANDEQYSPSSLRSCGNLGAPPVCPDPNVYIHWDGVHLTQKAYSRIAEILIKDLGFNCAEELVQGSLSD